MLENRADPRRRCRGFSKVQSPSFWKLESLFMVHALPGEQASMSILPPVPLFSDPGPSLPFMSAVIGLSTSTIRKNGPAPLRIFVSPALRGILTPPRDRVLYPYGVQGVPEVDRCARHGHVPVAQNPVRNTPHGPKETQKRLGGFAGLPSSGAKQGGPLCPNQPGWGTIMENSHT